MSAWKVWKSGFDRWERSTSEYLDKALQSPAILGPTGTILKTVMRTKSTANKMVARAWNTIGLTSRNEQDRAVHRINQLEGKILDLQEELQELREND
ncbi:MAG: hypothetical protein JKY56_25600 [Kofleriaceae bacterium]|nr:hypothetical protein [Kofleriaceae bacterium]